MPVARVSAKVVLVDGRGRVLLFRGHDPATASRGSFWFPPGGGVEPGETLAHAACREVVEEVGLQLDAATLGEVVLERRTEFAFEGVAYDQLEYYFLVEIDTTDVRSDGWSPAERRAIVSYRWWTLEELKATEDTVYPEGLAVLCSRIPSSSQSARYRANDERT